MYNSGVCFKKYCSIMKITEWVCGHVKFSVYYKNKEARKTNLGLLLFYYYGYYFFISFTRMSLNLTNDPCPKNPICPFSFLRPG